MVVRNQIELKTGILTPPKITYFGFTKSSFIDEDICLFTKPFPFLSQTSVLILFHLIWLLTLVKNQQIFFGLQDLY